MRNTAALAVFLIGTLAATHQAGPQAATDSIDADESHKWVGALSTYLDRVEAISH